MDRRKHEDTSVRQLGRVVTQERPRREIALGFVGETDVRVLKNLTVPRKGLEGAAPPSSAEKAPDEAKLAGSDGFDPKGLAASVAAKTVPLPI